jgi:transposase
VGHAAHKILDAEGQQAKIANAAAARSVATRYEKLAVTCLAMVTLAAILIWL